MRHFAVVTNSLHGVILKREVLKTVLSKNMFYIYLTQLPERKVTSQVAQNCETYVI